MPVRLFGTLMALGLASTNLYAAGIAVAPDIALEGVHWQVGRVESGRVLSWQDIKVLADDPPKFENRVRARLVLKNRGQNPAETLLIRYSMTCRIVSVSSKQAEGTWAVPFFVDEKRVPKIAANKMIEVPLETGAALKVYLRRLSRSGWWPDRIKIQVMLEPHPGASVIQTTEDIFSVEQTVSP